MKNPVHKAKRIRKQQPPKHPSQRLPLPNEKRVEEYYQAEIVEIDQLTNQIRINKSLSNAHEVISISQVFSVDGRPITNIHFLNGGVINVYKYHDHTEYFLGGTIGEGVRWQTFEEKLAIVENYTDPNFTMWLWETDERVQIHYKMLKLNGDFTYLEPQRFINSVVKLRYIVGGYPFSASLEAFRPQEPELPPLESNFPPLEPKISPSVPYLLPSERELSLQSSEVLPQEQMSAKSMLEIWKQIGDSLCDYIVHLTKNPGVSDLKFIKEIGGYLEKCNDPHATKLSDKLKVCANFIEKTEMQLLCDQLNEQPLMQQLKSNKTIGELEPLDSPELSRNQPPLHEQPVDSQSALSSQPHYPAQSQARPAAPYQPSRYAVAKCHSCGAEVQLYPFCSHEFCRNCIISSMFALKCLSCKASVQHIPHTAFEAFNIKCNGCEQMHLTIDVCDHKLCKECICLLKCNRETCFICDKALDDAYVNMLLGRVGLVCSLCNSQKLSYNFMVFDCKCNLCIDCALPSAQSSTCPKCHTPRRYFDFEQFRIYIG